MKYSLEPKYRKYVQGYGFLSFARTVVTVSTDEKDKDERNRDFVLKNNAPFISYISKTNGVLTENAEHLHVVN